MDQKLKIIVYSCIILHLTLQIYEFLRIPYITAPDYYPSYNMPLSNYVYGIMTRAGIIKYVLFLLVAVIIDYDFSVSTKNLINDSSCEPNKLSIPMVHKARNLIERCKAFISVFLYISSMNIMEFSFFNELIASGSLYFVLYLLYSYKKYLKIVLFAGFFIISLMINVKKELKVGTLIENSVLPSEIRNFMDKHGFSLSISKVDDQPGCNIAVINKKKEVLVIIFNETLKLFTEKEFISVLYHEIGHVMHNDVFNRIIASVSLQMLIYCSEFFMIKHSKKLLKKGSEVKNLIMLFMLLNITFLPLYSCAINYFTYNVEINADRFSISHAPREHLGSAITKLDAVNYSPHDSSWLYNVMYINHPTLTRRLKIIKDL